MSLRLRPRIGIWIVFALAALFHASDLSAQGASWTITPGVGHDQFEQSYFLEDTLGIDPDSLRALERTIEELKESYASVEAAYARGSTFLSNTFYATDAAARNVTLARARLRRNAVRFDLNGRLEWKGEDDRDSLSSSYLVGQFSATPRLEVSDHWSLLARADYEQTDYEVSSPYGQDYDRIRGRLGVRYDGAFLESLELTLGRTTRDVSDSARLSYDEDWVQVDASYWEWGTTTWSAVVSYRDRAYEEDGISRNHNRIAVEVSPRWQIGEKLRFDGLLSWEYWDYASDSGAYFDFSSGEVEPFLRYAASEEWEIAIGVRSRWESATTEPFNEDNFSDFGVGPSVTWRPKPLIWVEAGGLWGNRRYNELSTIYDDYGFVELDVRLDAAMGSHMTLSASASYEQENHDDPTRDADYFYGSFALRFPFRL
jgi:hypothetical protein